MKRFFRLICLAIIGLTFQTTLHAQPAGYTYGKQVTINAAQVGGSLSNFPVLISLTDNDLRSISNGGHVENTNGYDIVFYLDDCATLLSHQIEKYVGTTGQYIAWVQLPSLNNSANTKIVMFYGNSSVTTDPSNNGIWGSYNAIWHFSNNSFADATANSNNGTNSGTTNASGKIGDCRSFVSNTFITVPFHSSLNVTSSFTFQAWINPTVLSSSGGHGIFSKNTFFADYIFGLDWPQGANDALNCWLYNGGFTLYHAGTVQTGQWSNIAATFDGASVMLYLNGSLVGSTSRTANVTASSFGLIIGQGNGGLYSNFIGLIDEPRISPVAQDAAWLLTEYNNQNNPATFYAVSAEMTAAEACGLVLPVELLDFQAKPIENAALLTRRTASEMNNNGFHLEKSKDGRQFGAIGFVAGSGISQEERRYAFTDEHFHASAYYRLRQVDFDGQEQLSKLVFLKKEKSTDFSLYPNPATGWLTIGGLPEDETATLTLLDMNGQAVLINPAASVMDPGMDVSGLLPGIYFIEIQTSGDLKALRFVRR